MFSLPGVDRDDSQEGNEDGTEDECSCSGVVENMSYLILPDTGKKLEIFGKSKGEEMARASGSPSGEVAN